MNAQKITSNRSALDPRYTALKELFDSCGLIKYSAGSKKNLKLVDGLYYEHRLLASQWVLSVYRNVKTTGNDVEIAAHPWRLAWPKDDAGPVQRWLEAQKDRLQHLESGIHAHQTENAFRIGLKYDAALEFAKALCAEMARSTNRWYMKQAFPEKPVPTSLALPICADESAANTPDMRNQAKGKDAGEGALTTVALRMLQTVISTCAQSGTQSVAVSKRKELRFRDNQHFLDHVTVLLEQSEGRCALSQVRLDLSGGRLELSPSLDRKRSDGHYEPENLQIVARFVNRWKSDMSDEEFLALLETVRHP